MAPLVTYLHVVRPVLYREEWTAAVVPGPPSRGRRTPADHRNE
ncbi:hypothetical protein VA596_16215 [Amycolatopsis sp., V23-08]|uniref:Uncharacterized protein n=1 Tax=Amycolatopsis heterodermiae TaxID=3110235 RepID=A0ABU5R604_9PSEU|nr:hypothetical protein [Amycolatopsis sp., V23-08]MEA5361090.1 hypothetical protein [Amycolatopsis sp., V23-08]